MCGAPVASHHQLVVGVVPPNVSRSSTVHVRVKSGPGQLQRRPAAERPEQQPRRRGCRDPEHNTPDQQAPRDLRRGQRQPPDDQAGTDVGHPRQRRICTGHQQFAEQAQRVGEQIPEARIVQRRHRQGRPHPLAQYRHDNRGRHADQHQGAGAQQHQRDRQHEQHRVVGQDHIGELAVGAAQSQPDGPDRGGPPGQPGRRSARLGPWHPGPTGRQRQAYAGQHGERRRGMAVRDTADPFRVTGVVNQYVHGHHAQQRQAPRDIDTDQPSFLAADVGPQKAGGCCRHEFITVQ